MSVKYKLFNVWRNVVKVYIKVAGAWSTPDVVYVKQNLAWRVVAKKVPNVTGIAFDTAQSTLTALGFTVTKANTNSTDTTYQSFSGGFVQSQVPIANNLNNMLEAITLNTVTYSAAPPSFGPSFSPSFGGYIAPEPYTPPYTGGDLGGHLGYSGIGGGYFAPYSPPPGAGFIGSYCVLDTTEIRTNKGLQVASDLAIGDKLISIDVQEIDTNEDKINYHYWLSSTFTPLNIVETTVTRISRSQVTDLIRINEEYFTFEHVILIERDSEYEFVQVQFVKPTDKVLKMTYHPDIRPLNLTNLPWDHPYITFTPITDFHRFHYSDLEKPTVIDIGVEPYDVYFTKTNLSHNK